MFKQCVFIYSFSAKRSRWINLYNYRPNPQGNVESGVGSGASRDVYSLFWTEVSDSYLIGTDQRAHLSGMAFIFQNEKAYLLRDV